MDERKQSHGNSKLQKVLLILIVPVLLLSSFNLILFPHDNAQAINQWGDMKTRAQMQSVLYLNAIYFCMLLEDQWKSPILHPIDVRINASDAKNGNWFTTAGAGSSTEYVNGVLLEQLVTGSDFNDGRISCGEDDNALVKHALQLWGMTSDGTQTGTPDATYLLCDGINSE
ncbi:hypothetical protein FWF48_02975, partial [Candidatus Saccharibacteria bacterium]|nr:hypothetical protein [Candidatus Saccharibacteria bacterium]